MNRCDVRFWRITVSLRCARIPRHATKITRNEQMRVIFAVYYILGELWKTASYPQDAISNESLWIL